MVTQRGARPSIEVESRPIKEGYMNTPKRISSQDLCIREAMLSDDEARSADEEAELSEIRALIARCENLPRWRDAILVREDCWQDYVKEHLGVAGVLDTIPDYVVIDWEQTAQKATRNFSLVNFGSAWYWVLSRKE